VRLTTSLQVGAKYLGCVVCRFHVAASAGSAPFQKPVSNNLQKWFLSPTGRLNFGFVTKGKLTTVLITPSSWGSKLVHQRGTINIPSQPTKALDLSRIEGGGLDLHPHRSDLLSPLICLRDLCLGFPWNPRPWFVYLISCYLLFDSIVLSLGADVYAHVCSYRQCWASKCRGL
jgi:hypothetical protein